MKKSAIIFILLFTLAGCATTSSVKVVDKKASMGQTEGNGLVFFKLDCKGVIVPIVYFYLFPEAGEAKEKGVKLALREKGSFNGNFKYDPTYFLVELPAGTWQVRKISDNAEAATYLFGAIGHELMTSAGSGKLNEAILEFEVKPGQVRYLGTLKMSLEKKKAIFEEVLDQEEEAVKEFRDNYPNMEESLQKALVDFKEQEKQ
jgi:molybdopterin converting factor small subunit